MAKYVSFRLKAAKVSVTMAFLAVLGGLAEKARAAPPQPKASASAVDAFLKLDGIQGEASVTKNAFLKIESFANKLEKSFLKLDLKLTGVYSKAQVDATFLKTKSANSEFLKIDDASSQYLKIDDAYGKFLKLDGTAANSSELGGMAPDAFVQGNGSVATGALTLPIGGSAQTLLPIPGTNGEIIVVCTPAQTGGPGVTISINNGTDTTIPAFISVVDGDPTAVELGPGSTTLTAFTNTGGQLTLQTFPSAAFNDVTTLTVSAEQVGNNTEVVGQLLNGGT